MFSLFALLCGALEGERDREERVQHWGHFQSLGSLGGVSLRQVTGHLQARWRRKEKQILQTHTGKHLGEVRGEGGFSCVLRIHWPSSEVRDGEEDTGLTHLGTECTGLGDLKARKGGTHTSNTSLRVRFPQWRGERASAEDQNKNIRPTTRGSGTGRRVRSRLPGATCACGAPASSTR